MCNIGSPAMLSNLSDSVENSENLFLCCFPRLSYAKVSEDKSLQDTCVPVDSTSHLPGKGALFKECFSKCKFLLCPA